MIYVIYDYYIVSEYIYTFFLLECADEEETISEPEPHVVVDYHDGSKKNVFAQESQGTPGDGHNVSISLIAEGIPVLKGFSFSTNASTTVPVHITIHKPNGTIPSVSYQNYVCNISLRI